MGSDVTASALAKTGGVTNSSIAQIASDVLSNPTAAIAQGQAFLEDTIQQAGDAGLPGMMAAASGLAAGLPSGELAAGVKKVAGVLSSAEQGAALGSVIPGYGTAIGAAVGAIIGIVNNILGGANNPPEGEFRSTAEMLCFPNVPLSKASQDLNQLPMVAVPATWMNARIQLVGYQQSSSATPSGQIAGPGNFAWGAGWAAVPGSTPQSQNAAWYIAQAWMGQNSVSRAFALKGHAGNSLVPSTGADPTVLKRTVNANLQEALTIMGSNQNALNTAMGLLGSWYGQTFNTGWGVVTDISDVDGFLSPPFGEGQEAMLHAVSSAADAVNNRFPLDFTYYVSKSWGMISLSGNNGSYLVGPMAIAGDPTFSHRVASNVAYHNFRLCSMPDTLLVGLAEIACIVAMGLPVNPTGGVPQTVSAAQATIFAFHYVLGLSYTWLRAQKIDFDRANALPNPTTFQGGSSLGLPEDTLPQPHPNFSRVLGILQAKVQKTLATTAASQAKGSAAVSSGAFVTKPANSPVYALVNGKWVAPIAASASVSPATQRSSTGVAKATLAGAAALGAIWFLKSRRKMRR